MDTALPHRSGKRPSGESNSKVSSFLNRNFWNLWNKLCQICCHLVWTLKYPNFTVFLGFVGGHDFPLHVFVCSWTLKQVIVWTSNLTHLLKKSRIAKFSEEFQKAMSNWLLKRLKMKNLFKICKENEELPYVLVQADIFIMCGYIA